MRAQAMLIGAVAVGFLAGKFDFEDGLPPWPLFRFGVLLNDALGAAFEATTPAKVRAIDLATGYWQSSVMYAVVKHGIVDEVYALGDGATCGAVRASVPSSPRATASRCATSCS